MYYTISCFLNLLTIADTRNGAKQNRARLLDELIKVKIEPHGVNVKCAPMRVMK